MTFWLIIKNNNVTYRTISIWIVIWNIHSELEDPVLVQAMSDKYDPEPH